MSKRPTKHRLENNPFIDAFLAYSERQLEELDRLTELWLDAYERTSQAARK